MSSPPTQPDPKETVEARLCAYLEGDLSADEVAELDRHMAGNTAHRQLMAELADHRQWLRSLPKQPAPPEVSDAYQQQIERSMLMGEHERPAGRGGRWPQYALMAAMVAIVVGLGTLLALMLTNTGRGPTGPLAVNTPPHASTATQPVADAATSMARNGGASPPVPAAKPAPDTFAVAGPGNDVMSNAPRGTGNAGRSADNGYLNATGNITGNANVTVNAVGNNATDADTLSGTATQGKQSPQQFALSQYDAAKQEAGGLTQVAQAKDAAVGGPVYLSVTTADPAAVDGRVRAFVVAHRATLADAPAAVVVAAHAKSAPPAAEALADDQGRGDSLAKGATSAIRDRTAMKSSTPTGTAFGAGGRGPDLGAAPTTSPSVAVTPFRYVVTGLSAEQVRQLSGDLSATRDDRPQAIRRGDTVTVNVSQLAGRAGVSANNVVRVSTEGTITLPMIDPVAAAGATADQVAERVAGSYRRANLIAEPTVTVTPTPVGALYQVVTPARGATAASQPGTPNVASAGTTVVIDVRPSTK